MPIRKVVVQPRDIIALHTGHDHAFPDGRRLSRGSRLARLRISIWAPERFGVVYRRVDMFARRGVGEEEEVQGEDDEDSQKDRFLSIATARAVDSAEEEEHGCRTATSSD